MAAVAPMLLGLVTFSPLATPARAQSAESPGPYSAAANGSLVQLTAVEVEDVVTVADATVAPSSSGVDSTSTPRSQADASNLDATLLDALELPNLLTRSTQSAPPDNPEPATDEFLALDVAPVLDLTSGDTMAHARWAGDAECVAPDVPLATSESSAAGLELLNLGLTGSLADLGSGAAFTNTEISLPSLPGDGDPRAVQAESTTNLATVNLLGSAGMTVEVVGPAVLTARATGLAGGADVSYDAPLVRVSGGLVSDPVELTLANPEIEVNVTLLDLIDIATIRATLGTATDVVESADGTTASADASIVHLTIDLLNGSVQVLDMLVGAQSVEATAPAGGLDCDGPTEPEGEPEPDPIEVTKSASAATVAPGGTFDYTITASNVSQTCTLTDVRVVDVITGPAGASITSTQPTASSVDGMTVTWADAADIAPGGSAEFVVRVRVPTNATNGSTFSDTATVTGTCNGQEFTDDFTLGAPRVSSIALVGALPRTGGSNDLLFLAVPGLLISGAFALRRLRRAATVA